MIKLIENYSDANCWYRKYSNGWIEQGGKESRSFSQAEYWAFNFPYPFTAVPLSVSATCIAPRSSDSYGSEIGVKSGTLSSTGVTFINDGYGTNKTGYVWEAKGY